MNSSDISLGTILEADDTTAMHPQPWDAQVALRLPDRAFLRRLVRDLANARTSLDPRVNLERVDLDNVVRVMGQAQAVVQLMDEAATARFHGDAASELQRSLSEREQA